MWAEKQVELCEIVAEGPGELVWVPDNATAEVIGAERFERYCLPLYARFQEIPGRRGKRIYVHLDGRLKGLMEAVADSAIPIVEAFTPPPVGDLSVAEARRAWPGKVLWVNFPSSVHLQPPGRVEQVSRELLEESGEGRGFLLGVTEGMPEGAWEPNLGAMLRAANSF